jgi:hypothetical protein
MVMVLVDAGVRQAENGDILTVWDAILRDAGPEGAYGVSEFYRATAVLADEPTLRALADILDGWRPADTPAFTALLRGAEVELVALDPMAEEGEDLNLSVDVLRAALRQACSAGFSLNAQPDRSIFVPRSDCGASLSGETAIRYLNGIDLTVRPRAAFETLRQACLHGDSFTIEGPESQPVAELSCPGELAQHPGLFQIASLGRLADPL